MNTNEAVKPAELVHRVCPLCGRDNKDERILHGNISWNLKKCGQCQIVYIEDIPQYHDLQESFSWRQSWRKEKKRRQEKEKALHEIQDVIKSNIKKLKKDKLTYLVHSFIKSGPVLDVGCGLGKAISCCSRNIIPHGIEIEPNAAFKSNELFFKRGGRVVNAPAIEGIDKFKNNYFPGVVMNAYLEHESHPLAVLRKVRVKMKKNGNLIIKVPNYGCINRYFRGMKWCGYRFPDHVNYFTPSTLKKIITTSGFSIEKFGFFDRFPTNDNMWMVASPSN
jgi:2-polyprenyl-3-methyl-5-hydroxy-6-metoxy-1,4-benzoquinol methylase|tara:strand:+ start:669 stop:1502 length:834 start_codon:yes stop_codon:yes gene_type:complete